MSSFPESVGSTFKANGTVVQNLSERLFQQNYLMHEEA